MVFSNKRLTLVTLLVAALLALAACGGSLQQTGVTATEASGQTDAGTGLGKTDIKLGYMAWTDCESATNIAKQVLEQEGYEVELVAADAGVVYQALADGQIDAMLCAWLPSTHEDYVTTFSENIEEAGVNLEGARLGWAVPSYVEEVNSIEDLKGQADLFKGEIIGIDPGAGLMRLSEQAVEAYGLGEEYRLVESSDATMTTALGSAIQKQEPIIVTSWAPHIMWAKFDLKWLEDPQGTLGEAEHISTMVRKGFAADSPRAHEVLSNLKIAPDTLAEVMLQVVEGGDVEQVAEEFISANPELIGEWTN